MAISDIDTFVMLGASITYGMTVGRETAWQNYIEGVTGNVVTVVNEGVPADTISDMNTRLNTILPTYVGDANVIFCLHGIANDAILGTPPDSGAPWSGLTPSAQAALYTEFDTFVQRIKDNGNKVDIATSTFWDVGIGSDSYAESIGTKPFNDNIVIPLAAIHNEPELFDYVNNVPVSDMYTWSYNNHTASQLPDGLHYTDSGTEALSIFRIDRMIRAIYLGETVLPLIKLVDPTNSYSTTASRFVIDCANTGTFRPSLTLLGITQAATIDNTDEEVFAAGDKILPVTYTSTVVAAADSAYAAPANKTATIYNSNLLNSMQYTTTEGGPETITLKNLGAGSKWLVRFACSTDLAVSAATDITIGTTSFTALAKDSGVLETGVLIGDTGEIDITYSASAGFSFGVINGFEFIPFLDHDVYLESVLKSVLKDPLQSIFER